MAEQIQTEEEKEKEEEGRCCLRLSNVLLSIFTSLILRPPLSPFIFSHSYPPP